MSFVFVQVPCMRRRAKRSSRSLTQRARAREGGDMFAFATASTRFSLGELK